MDARASLGLLAGALHALDDPAIQARLLQGMLKGLEGRRDVPAPDGWAALSTKLAASPSEDVRRMSRQLGQVFGDEDATRTALATVADRSAAAAVRKTALAALVTQRHPELGVLLPSLLAEEALRLEAIRAFGAIEVDGAPALLLALLPDAAPDHQRAIMETLSTRKPYAEALFGAMQAGRVQPESVPAWVARSLAAMLGDRYTQFYGTPALGADKEAQIAAYRKRLTPVTLASADASRGRAVFQKTCMACHLMFGEGGSVGPDLTGSNRADLDYLLLNILDPGGDIPDAYQMTVVTTRGGQVVTGTVVEENDQRLVLNMVGQRTTVQKDEIISRTTPGVSMMPEGLLATLDDREVLDLVNYLQTPHQVDLPR